MEWVETTGRTVDDAKEAALDELGVAEEDAEFEVLEEPRQGLFGRLRTEARVRARVRPTKPRPKEDRRRRGRRRAAEDDTPDGAEGDVVKGAPAKRGRTKGEQDKGRGRNRGSAQAAEVEGGATEREPAPMPDDAGEDAGAADVAEPPDATTPQPRRNPARARRGRRTRRGGQRTGASLPEAPSTKEKTVADDVDLQGQATLAEEFLSGLVEAFELEAEITTHFIDDETFEVRAEGDDLGLMIGPKGVTLAAVQELTRTAVQRQVVNRTGRILVDVGSYQRRRKEALARFTRQLAEEVASSGTRKILEPMSAADRKVVHDTCNEIDGVQTVSEGEDPRRRVVIEPAG